MTKYRLTLCVAVILSATTGFSQVKADPVANAGPAQRLVDRTCARHPELLDVLMHVTPPDQLKNVVIAAHLPKDLGEVSGDDDLGVANTGKPLVEVQKDGVRIGVLLQMQDAHRKPIGAIGLMFPWHAGDKQDSFLKRATHIRDQIAAEIPFKGALFAGS